MPRRKPKYPEKPWHPDAARWKGYMEKGAVKHRLPDQPKGGWQLFRLDTLEDVDQTENQQRCSTS